MRADQPLKAKPLWRFSLLLPAATGWQKSTRNSLLLSSAPLLCSSPQLLSTAPLHIIIRFTRHNIEAACQLQETAPTALENTVRLQEYAGGPSLISAACIQALSAGGRRSPSPLLPCATASRLCRAVIGYILAYLATAKLHAKRAHISSSRQTAPGGAVGRRQLFVYLDLTCNYVRDRLHRVKREDLFGSARHADRQRAFAVPLDYSRGPLPWRTGGHAENDSFPPQFFSKKESQVVTELPGHPESPLVVADFLHSSREATHCSLRLPTSRSITPRTINRPQPPHPSLWLTTSRLLTG
ncbi:hypothetical protein EYF80_035317 [Liparis tanakae]|uniref:Uncharacterized protein n=1 Tax=Liparis tanakae TaxID=230148 RepID=A0A4Z2GMD0_9TELE|nr:hypothetical protein EYF80_035317 [Liparis tanakae]